MKKSILIATLTILIILPVISALSLNVEKESSNEVMIVDINRPAVFDLKITNYGDTESVEFYNLLGFSMVPIGTVLLPAGETKNIPLMVYPKENFKTRGYYIFPYYIQSASSNSQIDGKLTVKIIELKDAFEVGSGEVYPDSNSIDIYIHNKENFNFGNTKAVFSSPFFNFEEEFSLSPYEKKTFKVQLNREDFKKLMAGYYTLNVGINIDGKKTNVEGVVKFVEKSSIITTTKDSGLIVNTHAVTKSNEGNVVVTSNTLVKKNIVSRLFTSFNPEPTSVDREGFIVYYTWTKDIKPGEKLEIATTTNWTFPLLIAFFIIVVVILVKQYTKTNLILDKRISFVKAKGGEFALKVTINVTAKKYLQRISVIDRLPPLVKLYGRFGAETPKRMDLKTRKLEWYFDKLDAGESRVLSYIIYSKVGVLGRFALPPTTANFERNGVFHESESNRAFFVADQRIRED
ncbi:MAG: hypothetical protein Q7R52_03840 [archaeon]|nr:hypothetical protein [archaeon]